MTLTKEEIEMIEREAEELFPHIISNHPAAIQNAFNHGQLRNAYTHAATKYLLQLKAERERAEYWSKRCLAAENCLDKSPCDPDITKDQIEAHRNWEAAKKNEYNNTRS